MKEIKDVIAQNLIDLRKSRNLTQNDLAEKLNYSDNTISRWEHGEITPSIEMLDKIAKLFDVPIESLIKENVLQNSKKENKKFILNQIASTLLCICMVWFIAAVCYFYIETFQEKSLWIIFVWTVPISFLILVLFSLKLKNRILIFIFSTLLIWTFIASLYLHFLKYNLYLLFIIGIPAQASLSIWTFVKKRG